MAAVLPVDPVMAATAAIGAVAVAFPSQAQPTVRRLLLRGVLACFELKWPNLKMTVAGFEFMLKKRADGGSREGLSGFARKAPDRCR